MRPVVRMMARWLLLRRIAGLGKTWRPPSPPPESFSTGKRGAVEFRDTVKPTVWGRRQGKKTPSAIDRVGNRVLDPELAKYRGWTKGRQGDKHERRKKPPDTVSVESSSASWEKLDQGKNHRGSVVKRASATGAWSLDGLMMDGSRWRKDPWPRAGSTGGLERVVELLSPVPRRQ